MMGFGWMGLGLLLPLLLIVGIVAIAVGWRPAQSNQDHIASSASNHSSALDILKERYARGEITREQYESMKQDII